MADLELRRGEEFRVGGDGDAYVVAHLVLNGDWIASGFHVPADRFEALTTALDLPAREAAIRADERAKVLAGVRAELACHRR